jgi:hypothetical protein
MRHFEDTLPNSDVQCKFYAQLQRSIEIEAENATLDKHLSFALLRKLYRETVAGNIDELRQRFIVVQVHRGDCSSCKPFLGHTGSSLITGNRRNLISNGKPIWVLDSDFQQFLSLATTLSKTKIAKLYSLNTRPIDELEKNE